MFVIILRQMVIMSIYISIGYLLRSKGLMSKEGNRSLSNLLLYVILPCAIINSFLRENNPETTRALLISLGLSVLMLGTAILISRILLKKEPVDNFSASFSNAGFMGIPLVTATLGNQYIIYTATFVALVNILQWTYGQHIMSKNGTKVQFSIKKLILTPIVLSLLIGLLLYFLPITVPIIVTNSIGAIAACNAPIAMIILGYYLRELPMKNIISFPRAYWVSTVRLVLIPAISILILALIPGLALDIKFAILICAAAPVGSNVAIYAERNGQDYGRSVIMVCLSTILSIVTMPLMILLLDVLVNG